MSFSPPRRAPATTDAKSDRPKLAHEYAQEAIGGLISGLASFFGDALRLAVVSGVLYFMGVVYFSEFSSTSGLPIDPYALPVQAVFIAPWEALLDSLGVGLYAGWLLVAIPVVLWGVEHGAVWISAKLANKQTAKRKAKATAKGGKPDDFLQASALPLAYRMAAATGAMLLLAALVVAAGNKGQRDGSKAIANCADSVLVVPVKDARLALPHNAQFCGRYGNDLLFVDRGASHVFAIQESQVSMIVRPRRPRRQ